MNEHRDLQAALPVSRYDFGDYRDVLSAASATKRQAALQRKRRHRASQAQQQSGARHVARVRV